MSTTLKASIAFVGVAAGATAALPHTLNVNGIGATPDKIEVDNGDFTVVGATGTTVTVRNNSGSAADVNTLVEHWHTFDRVFGAASVTALTPQPFIPQAPLPANSPSFIYPANTEEIRYVRSTTGDDANDGLTPATAWLTLDRGLSFLAGFSTNRNLILDVSDSAFSDAEQLNFPALFGGINADLDFAGVGPNSFIFKSIGQIRASQALQQALTVTLVTPDAVTGMPVLSVSEALAPGAHVGQFVIGSGLVEYGVVVANDASTLTLASTGTTFTAPVGAYLPSTTFTFGDAANFFQQAVYINMFANYVVQGISFLTNGAAQTALTVLPTMPWNIQLCQIQGLMVKGGAQEGIMDACYVTRRFGLDGASMQCRSSFFDTCSMENHGDGATGLNAILGCYFDSCGPVLGGNFESRMSIQMQNSEIANGTAQGMIVRGGGNNRVVDSRIRDNASDGILADAPLRLRIDNVVGTGNVGYGARLENGAQAEVLNAPTVTGTVGDVFLGGSGTTAWAAAPATDVGAVAPQFCRIF